jgi:hypothetical protein
VFTVTVLPATEIVETFAGEATEACKESEASSKQLAARSFFMAW